MRPRAILPRLGVLLLLLAGGILFAAELGRLGLERSFGRLLQVPVRVQRITLSPRRLTLHEISVGGSNFPLIGRLQIQGPLLPLLGRGDVKRIESVTVTGVTLSVAGIPLQAQGRLFLR